MSRAFRDQAEQAAKSHERVLHFLIDLEAAQGHLARYIVESSFGLNGRGRSTAELALELGMSRNEVKAIKRRALGEPSQRESWTEGERLAA